MTNFFRRLTGRSQPPSKDVARDRLKLVLIHDRTDVSPAIIENIKDEIITVISKHVDIDRDGVEIKLQQEDNENRLVADIPILKSPRRRAR
ncbi:MAG: cell division topological specificity factor MinE [Chloroflexi bacterium]|nr:cell division topological specificity factor MinE [Chloroflexota bacterium]